MNADKIYHRLSSLSILKIAGKVTQSIGLTLEAQLPCAVKGSVCKILSSVSQPFEAGIDAEVIGFRGQTAILMPYDDIQGLNHESYAVLTNIRSMIPVGSFLLGRTLDARCIPLDDLGALQIEDFEKRNLYNSSEHPLKRSIVTEPLDLGIKAMNGLLTCGRGQRIGIMAGSGVGKSMLLGMIARFATADINIIALVGERGREVGEFLKRDIPPETLKKSVIIVTTSDKSALLRVRAAYLATTIAEYFRDQGKHVLLMMDSVTRFCMALREIHLGLGELPASKGYTPSVFSVIPKLLERAGTGIHGGSITGIYSVLVDGEDMDDPIADTIRGILDGHIVLSRKIASKGHFPAIDILQSTSRVMNAITSMEHQEIALKLRKWLAAYAEVEDLLQIGAYVRGIQPLTDQAVLAYPYIQEFLQQHYHQIIPLEMSIQKMKVIEQQVQSQIVFQK